jgi:hypothetical protein
MHSSQHQRSREVDSGIRLPERARFQAALVLLMISGLTGCHGTGAAVTPAGRSSMELTSSSFRDGRLPNEFTCDGAGRSPQLAWAAPPATARSLALIVTDPDAPVGTFVHWVLFNVPAAQRELPAALPTLEQLPDGSRQGRNDFGNIGYGGPCPPGHSTHRYIFDLYALDATLNLQPGATRKQVEAAMQGHILSRGEVIWRYSR